MVYLSDAGLPGFPEKRPLKGCSTSGSSNIYFVGYFVHNKHGFVLCLLKCSIMPPKKGKKNAITCFIESVIVPEKQQQGYQFRNGIAALIPEASQRYKVNALVYVVPVLSLPQLVISPYITSVATNLHILK